MSVLLLAMPGEEARAERLAPRLAAEVAAITVGRGKKPKITLPDGADGRPVAVLTTLEDLDPAKPLVWEAARRLGEVASSIGLVAPHVRWLDHDDANTRAFAQQMKEHFGWLVTVDPHPAAFSTFTGLFKGPTKIVTAAPAVAGWIRKNVGNPVLIGPDPSSEPWVGTAARKVGAPFVVLQRDGDKVIVPDADRWWSYAPVLVSETAGNGATLAALVRRLMEEGLPAPACVVVHGVFDDEELAELTAAGATKIVSCDTVSHETNAIRLDAELAQAITALAGR